MSDVDFMWGDETVAAHEQVAASAPGSTATLPADSVSDPDSNGVYTKTTYRWAGSGDSKYIEKVTKYMKQSSKTTVTNHSAKVRRTWQRFGAAATTTDTSNVTYQVADPVPLEIPGQVTQDADIQSKLMKTLKEGQKQNAFKAKFQALMGTGDEAGGEGGDSAAAGAGTAYSEKAQQAISQMQQRMSGGVADTSFEQQGCTIRISSLSKAASRDDVRELCQNFGRVTRCSVPRDKEGESRGYAYCDFSSPEEAQRAIKGLDGYGYDYLILSVSLVENRASDPQRTSMRHATGYGKALPQS
ncbi:TIF35 [Symbiodinium sp. KB8]|nr:TIF35 [Symbiodinium sp. KB8]